MNAADRFEAISLGCGGVVGGLVALITSRQHHNARSKAIRTVSMAGVLAEYTENQFVQL